VVGNDNFKLSYGWFSRAVSMVEEGANRLGSGTSEYIDPTPQRKGRPDDIAFRAMPAHAQTRYAAGLEKMSTKGIEATFGEVAKAEWLNAWNEWDAFGKHVYLSHNEVMRDGKKVRDKIQLDDACFPDRFKKMPQNQLYWTMRWADQMNYRYWKERAQAEMTKNGVLARQLFYEGTVAYKTGDFPTAAEKFKEGLNIWKIVMSDFPTYRDDDLSKRETGQIVKRYVKVLRQNLSPIPEDLPFKDYLRLVEHDTTVDPFDAIEMLGVGGEARPVTPAPAPPGPSPISTVPANPPK